MPAICSLTSSTVTMRSSVGMKLKLAADKDFGMGYKYDLIIEDGKVTDAGMEEMKKRMPHVDFSALESNRDVNNIRFTVTTVVNYIEHKLKTA